MVEIELNSEIEASAELERKLFTYLDTDPGIPFTILGASGTPQALHFLTPKPISGL